VKGRAIAYSAAELRFLEANGTMPRRELWRAFVRKFGRRDVTLDHIKSVCTRRGWTTRRQRWTRRDDARLRRLYPDTPTADVAQQMGRTACAIYGRADILGLKKSAAYLASPAACRLRRGDNIGAPHRFMPGHVPANKGLRRPGWTAGRMKETQFTKGQRGWNWKPIGSERLMDGYRYTKVDDQRQVPYMVNWKPTHVLKWEALNGPIPKGMCLKSLDGVRTNVDPSNWIAVPRAMLPRLSGKSGRDYDNAPAELKPTIMAVAKLEDAVRRRRRSA
jgi:hypothetical protein